MPIGIIIMMITQKLLYDRYVGKDEVTKLYADVFASRFHERSFSYHSMGGGFAEMGGAPSAEDIGMRVRGISGPFELCEMKRDFLGYLGPTTKVLVRNTDRGESEVTILGSADNVHKIRKTLDNIMGSSSMLVQQHTYKKSFNTRINSYFGGRVPVTEFNQKLERLNDLSTRLTGRIFLTEQDVETYEGKRYLNRDSDYQRFIDEEGEMNLSLRASCFEPCPAIPNDSIGYGVELILRGNRKGVEKGFGDSLGHLGYPLRVEVPSLLYPSFLDNWFANRNEYHSNTTNWRGWRAAKKVIKESGAQLKAKMYSICRFPYNLLIRDAEGKVVKDGKVLDPLWGVWNGNVLEAAMERGQVGSITVID